MNFTKVGNNPNAQCNKYSDCNYEGIDGFKCGSNNMCQCQSPYAWDGTNENCDLCDASQNYIMDDGDCGNLYFFLLYSS